FTTKMKTEAILSSTILNSLLGLNTLSVIHEDLRLTLQQSLADGVTRNGSASNRRSASAWNAAHPFSQPVPGPSTAPPPVELRCIGVKTLPNKEPVFNLAVEDAHEYYANGIRVHNCSWVPGMASPNRMDAL